MDEPLMTEPEARFDPYVSPAWRWRSAKRLARNPSLMKPGEDPVMEEAAEYLRKPDQKRFPAIHSARKIYRRGGLFKAEVEAWVLVGQSNEEIGNRYQLPPEVIAVYHDLFLWVRPFLGSGWVHRHKVGGTAGVAWLRRSRTSTVLGQYGTR